MATTKKTATTPKTNRKSSDASKVVPLNTDISQQLEVLRGDLKSLAETVKLQAKASVESRTLTARTVAEEKTEAAKVRYDELTTKAETQIREKPLTSMAVAVGTGLLLGAILRK